jgi:hypothetical protein
MSSEIQVKMIELFVIIWTHFIADFILQTDKVALNKSKNNAILLLHVLIYTMPFLSMCLVWRMSLAQSIQFCLLTALLHFVTDFFSSRACSALWKKNQRHWFFVVIGLDQAIHMTCLILVWELCK